jgi:hypothetical protein
MTANITIIELYELYIDTLQKCSSEVFNKAEAEVEYDILEDFTIGAVSFLHEDSLKKLLSEKFIDDEMFELSMKLREIFFRVEEKLRIARHIKDAPELKELVSIADRILELPRK